MQSQFIYRDQHDSKLIETHWCAAVSHHHFYFETLDDLIHFYDGEFFDSRMTISTPTA
jgi:hypothetical protein